MSVEQLSIFDFLSSIEEETERGPEGTLENKPEDLNLLPYVDVKEVPSVYQMHSFMYSESFSLTDEYVHPDLFELSDSRFIEEEQPLGLAEFTRMRKGFISFFESQNFFSGAEVEELKKRLEVEKLPNESLYVPTFLVEAFEQLPLINFKNTDEKMINFLSTVLNVLFENNEKRRDANGLHEIQLDELFIEKVKHILTDFPLHEDDSYKIKEDKLKDFYLLHDYVYFLNPHRREYEYQNERLNMDFNGLLYEHTKSSLVSYDKETGLLSIDTSGLEPHAQTVIHGGNFFYVAKTLVVLFQIMYFLVDAYPLFLGLLKEEDEQNTIDFTEEAILFQEGLNERLIPLGEVSHKTGVKKARDAGLTHLFLPFSNRQPLFKAEVPVLINKERSTNETNHLVPFIENEANGDIFEDSIYKGYYDKYPTLSTRKEPHITGEALERGIIDEEEFNEGVLRFLEERDESLFKVVQKSLEIIESHPIVRNRLESVYYEEDKVEENLVVLYDNLFKQELDAPESTIKSIIRAQDSNGDELKEGKYYRLENKDDEKSFYLKVMSIEEDFSDSEIRIIVKGVDPSEEEIIINNTKEYTFTHEYIDYTPFYHNLIKEKIEEQRGTIEDYEFSYYDKSNYKLYYFKDNSFYQSETAFVSPRNIGYELDRLVFSIRDREEVAAGGLLMPLYKGLKSRSLPTITRFELTHVIIGKDE